MDQFEAIHDPTLAFSIKETNTHTGDLFALMLP